MIADLDGQHLRAYLAQKGGRTAISAGRSPIEIVLPFWQGLRELASRARAEGFRSHWSGPFPFDALDRLTERVERAGG